MGLPETLRDLALALGMNTGTLFLSLGPGVIGVAAARGLWGRLPDEGKNIYCEYSNCTRLAVNSLGCKLLVGC